MSDWHYGNHCLHHSLWIWKNLKKKTQKLSPNAFILCYYTLLLPLVPIFIEILSIYCLGGAIGKVREYATLLYRFWMFAYFEQILNFLWMLTYMLTVMDTFEPRCYLNVPVIIYHKVCLKITGIIECTRWLVRKLGWKIT